MLMDHYRRWSVIKLNETRYVGITLLTLIALQPTVNIMLCACGEGSMELDVFLFSAFGLQYK
jgi:hypothetical protein